MKHCVPTIRKRLKNELPDEVVVTDGMLVLSLTGNHPVETCRVAGIPLAKDGEHRFIEKDVNWEGEGEVPVMLSDPHGYFLSSSILLRLIDRPLPPRIISAAAEMPLEGGALTRLTVIADQTLSAIEILTLTGGRIASEPVFEGEQAHQAIRIDEVPFGRMENPLEWSLAVRSDKGESSSINKGRATIKSLRPIRAREALAAGNGETAIETTPLRPLVGGYRSEADRARAGRNNNGSR